MNTRTVLILNLPAFENKKYTADKTVRMANYYMALSNEDWEVPNS